MSFVCGCSRVFCLYLSLSPLPGVLSPPDGSRARASRVRVRVCARVCVVESVGGWSGGVAEKDACDVSSVSRSPQKSRMPLRTKKAAPEQPWWTRNAKRQEQWKDSLRKQGVTFAIGHGPCKQRSKAACRRKADAVWVSEEPRACDAAASTNDVTGASTDWANWSVPTPLIERGASEGDPALYRPLLTKLEAGEPVTLLALGSSVVGAHAGCTAAWPALKQCPCPKCCGSRCGRWGGGGWALRLLARLNATWPHAGHRLFNLGEPGGDLMPSILACPSSYLSFAPDIVMVDFFTSYHGGRDALIYERMARSSHFPWSLPSPSHHPWCHVTGTPPPRRSQAAPPAATRCGICQLLRVCRPPPRAVDVYDDGLSARRSPRREHSCPGLVSQYWQQRHGR